MNKQKIVIIKQMLKYCNDKYICEQKIKKRYYSEKTYFDHFCKEGWFSVKQLQERTKKLKNDPLKLATSFSRFFEKLIRTKLVEKSKRLYGLKYEKSTETVYRLNPNERKRIELLLIKLKVSDIVHFNLNKKLLPLLKKQERLIFFLDRVPELNALYNYIDEKNKLLKLRELILIP